MKRAFLFYCLLFSFSPKVFCQENVLQGYFKKGKGDTLYLQSFYGVTTVLLDSCVVNTKGAYHFKNREYATGFYRLSSGTRYTDCILDEKTVTVIDFEEKSLAGKTTVRKGINQQGLLALKEQKMTLKAKITPLMSKPVSKESKEKVLNLMAEDEAQSQKIINDYKGTFFALTASLALKEKPNNQVLAEYKGDTLAYFRDHFFDGVDFSNASLSRSTILPNLYMRYLSKYVDYDETGFKTAVDLMLGKAKANTVLYNLTLEYLLDLFEKAGPEIIFEYILEKYYLDNSCQELEMSGQTKEKISRYQQLLPDQQAPVLSGCVDKKNVPQGFNSIDKNAKDKPILLFFWSTHCHFCQDLVNFIQTNANNSKIQLVGININEEKSDWMNFEFQAKIPLLNLHAPGGWESETAREYMVNKTPTIYLLDKDRKIERKNLSLEEVKLLLSK